MSSDTAGVFVTFLLLFSAQLAQSLSITRNQSVARNSSVANDPLVASNPFVARKPSKVLILGAGMAGIQAAYTLQMRGQTNFTILEAYNRIGGRVLNSSFKSGHVANMGAQTITLTLNEGAKWIHGVEKEGKANPLWDWVKRSGLKTKTSNFEKRMFYLDSEKAFLHETDSRLKKAVKKLEEITDKLEDAEQFYTGSESLQDALEENRWPLRDVSPSLQQAIEWYEFDFELAESPELTAATHSIPYTYTAYGKEEKIVTDDRGYNHLIDYMASRFLTVDSSGKFNDPRLHLNSNVVTINYEGSNIVVTTDSGAVYKSEYVIVTFSLGVLKKGKVRFTPELPKKKLEAISRFHMGLLNNIFLKFKKPFWSKDWNKDVENFVYASDQRGYYPAYANMFSIYDSDEDWPVLIVFVTGDMAMKVEKQSEELTVSEIMEVLKKMFGKSAPYPVETLISKWGSDSRFYGSYSNWPPTFTDDNFGDLSGSVDNRVFFAGEAMSQYYYGFLHGAYQSGQDIGTCVSEKLHDVYGSKCPRNVKDAYDSSVSVSLDLLALLSLIIVVAVCFCCCCNRKDTKRNNTHVSEEAAVVCECCLKLLCCCCC